MMWSLSFAKPKKPIFACFDHKIAIQLQCVNICHVPWEIKIHFERVVGVNFLKIFFFLIIVLIGMLVGDIWPACREYTCNQKQELVSEQPYKKQKTKELEGQTVDELYVTPQEFFDNKKFTSALKFIADHKELKRVIILPAFPVYGKEDAWEHFFTEGDERACYSPEKVSSFTYDWYKGLASGWLDKFNELCKQVDSHSKINVALFMPQTNSENAVAKIKSMSFGRQLIWDIFDYSPMHMVWLNGNKPIYIFENPSIFQANTWECGYYAAFNACIVYNLIQRTYEKFPYCLYRLNMKRPVDFEKFYQVLFLRYPTISSMHKQQQRLHINDGIKLLDVVFGRKIEEVPNVLLVVQTKGSKFYNFGHGCRYGIMKKDFAPNKPLVVIFKAFAHWNCFVFTESAIFILDSSSACQYAQPQVITNLYNYLIAKTKTIFATEDAAKGTEDALYYCDIRDLHIDNH